MNQKDDDGYTNIHSLKFVHMLFHVTPQDFSVRKQEERNSKVLERIFKKYKYPAITITIIETPAT